MRRLVLLMLAIAVVGGVEERIQSGALLKRFLVMLHLDALDDVAVALEQHVNRDADLSVIVCAAQPSTASVSSVSLEEFEVHLPALTVAPHATGCGTAWPISQSITRVIALGGVALPRGAQVFRTSTCSPDIAEFVLSIAALTGQAYAFYLPFIRRPEEAMSGGEGKGGEDDDTEGVGAGVWKDQPPSQEEMLAWMAEFPREYDDSMARRRMMGRVGVAALRRYHRDDPASRLPPAGCSERARLFEGKHGDAQKHASGPSPRLEKSERRFVYLATGESEQDFAYAADLVSFDADVILCVWGAPGLGGAEQGDLRCEVECTGDARKVCRDVCRGASPGSARRLKGEGGGGGGGGGMGEVHYLYVGNSSFQQGRNHLYLEAQRLGNYAYFIFLVDDLSVVQVDFGTGMLAENAYRTLEQYLVTWQPALAVSGAARRDDDFHIDPRAEVTSVYGFDHLLMAVHTDAADALLPYSLELEDVSWWYSEYVVNLAAAGLFGPHYVVQFHAVFAETYRHGYLAQLHAHEYTCVTPTDPLAQPRVGPLPQGYGHIWGSLDHCNPEHPYFFAAPARRRHLAAAVAQAEEASGRPVCPSEPMCERVNVQVADMLYDLLEQGQRRNGTVCGWCLWHPRSPLTSNCANRLNGVELPLDLDTATGQRAYSLEQQLRLGIGESGVLID